MIRALVFDFDGLMVDTESALIEAYADIHARYGVAFERELFLRSVGHADYSFDPWHAFEKRANRARLETERRQRNRERDQQLPILPGVVALVESARTAGLRLAVASNSTRGHVDGHLRRVGLISHFEILFCREDVASPKPEPDLYRMALNQFGLKGREAVALEDSQTGVLAAHRAGLGVVAVPNASTAHHDFKLANWKVKSLADVTLDRLQAKFSAGESTP